MREIVNNITQNSAHIKLDLGRSPRNFTPSESGFPKNDSDGNKKRTVTESFEGSDSLHRKKSLSFKAEISKIELPQERFEDDYIDSEALFKKYLQYIDDVDRKFQN